MAKAFCILVGSGVALIGAVGFALPQEFTTSHNLVHLVTGALLVSGAWFPPACFVFAAAYVAAPIAGLVPTGPVETVLHTALVVGALAAGGGFGRLLPGRA